MDSGALLPSGPALTVLASALLAVLCLCGLCPRCLSCGIEEEEPAPDDVAEQEVCGIAT